MYRILGGRNIAQYTDVATGDIRITWTIPLANSHEYGRLYSSAIGAFGDRLTFTTPVYGDIPVAFHPGPESFKVSKHQPQSFGYEVAIVFVRLT